MKYVLSEDQMMIKELADNLTENEIAPRSEAVDHQQAFPEEGIAFLAESGLIGCSLPETYGGAQMDAWCQVAVIESAASACASTAWTAALAAEAAECLMAGGTEEQKEEYLPQIAEGTPVTVAAVTQVFAEEEADGWKLSGKAEHVPNAFQSSFFLVSADCGGERKWFIIDKEAAGLSVQAEAPLLGMKGCVPGTLEFDGCMIGSDKLLQRDVTDAYEAAAALDMAAIAAGILRGSAKTAIQYDNQRVQFGKTIASFENTQMVLADILAQAEAARALVWQAANTKAAGGDWKTMALMAKNFAAGAAAEGSRKCLQMMGGYGYSREYPIERKMRDAKMTEILAGTTYTNQLRIAEELVLEK